MAKQGFALDRLAFESFVFTSFANGFALIAW